jgi:hypothetical protein
MQTKSDGNGSRVSTPDDHALPIVDTAGASRDTCKAISKPLRVCRETGATITSPHKNAFGSMNEASVDRPGLRLQNNACSGGVVAADPLIASNPTLLQSPPDALSLHWSEISMLMRCPVQYDFRYVKGIRRPPGIAAHVGSGVHTSAEMNLHEKMMGRGLLKREDVSDVARDTVIRKIDTDGVLLSEDEASKGLAAVKGEAVDKATRLALLHYDELAPHIEPVGIEIPWTVDVRGAGIILAGRIDLEVAGGIRDLKTAGKTPPADSAGKADQLTMYSVAYRVLRGRMPETLGLDYLVDTKTPSVCIQQTKRDEKDLAVFLRRVSTAAKVIQSGAFMPCDRSSWVCSKRFCGYYDMCEYVR